MISQNAIGYEADIKYLLENSMLNMDRAQIKAWMQYQFDPSNMYCVIEDDRVISCLQTRRRVLSFNNKKCMASIITLAATLPDYRQRGHFESLLEAYINQASQNDLVSVLYTTFPKLFESRSFQMISKTKSYWLPSIKVTKGTDRNIHSYNAEMDLYPTYKQFIKHFDGSIVYTQDELKEQIEYYIKSGKKVIVSYNEDKEMDGFAIYKSMNGYAKVDIFVYLNSKAANNILRYLGNRNNSITFKVSENERFEKLFPLDAPRNQGAILAKLNNYKLFSKWIGKEVRTVQQAYDLLDKPCWNHFID